MAKSVKKCSVCKKVSKNCNCDELRKEQTICAKCLENDSLGQGQTCTCCQACSQPTGHCLCCSVCTKLLAQCACCKTCRRPPEICPGNCCQTCKQVPCTCVCARCHNQDCQCCTLCKAHPCQCNCVICGEATTNCDCCKTCRQKQCICPCSECGQTNCFCCKTCKKASCSCCRNCKVPACGVCCTRCFKSLPCDCCLLCETLKDDCECTTSTQRSSQQEESPLSSPSNMAPQIEPPNMGILKDRTQLEFYIDSLERWGYFVTATGVKEELLGELVITYAFSQNPELCRELSDHFGSTLRNKKDGIAQITKWLKEKYGLNKHADMVKVLNNFLNTCREKGENLADFISRFEKNLAEVKKMGETLSETCLSILLLRQAQLTDTDSQIITINLEENLIIRLIYQINLIILFHNKSAYIVHQ